MKIRGFNQTAIKNILYSYQKDITEVDSIYTPR